MSPKKRRAEEIQEDKKTKVVDGDGWKSSSKIVHVRVVTVMLSMCHYEDQGRRSANQKFLARILRDLWTAILVPNFANGQVDRQL